MPIVCPTVLAANDEDYRIQIERIASFGHRIQIDLTDGIFASNRTLEPEHIWWPAGVKADIHLMYKSPASVFSVILKQNPHMVIIHSEAAGDFEQNFRMCRDTGVKLGVALLPGTDPSILGKVLNKIDHILIFSGELGHFGGSANLNLLDKAAYIKQKAPDIEIGWDGGINDMNVSELVLGGVEVLNVGGYIQKAENPEKAYNTLFRIADETGTT